MAKYGAFYSRWAPFAAEQADADKAKLPKYGAVINMGELNKVNETLNFREGSLYGDDQIALYEKNFKDGTLDVESVYLAVTDAASMLGAACDDKNGLAHGDNDVAPYGGYGNLTRHLKHGMTYYQVIFYPKTKASVASENYETRGENIAFTTDKMSLHVESPACHKFKIIKDFETEAEAIAYLEALFAGTAAVPGLPAPAAQTTT
jgi:hypothetical protein